MSNRNNKFAKKGWNGDYRATSRKQFGSIEKPVDFHGKGVIDTRILDVYGKKISVDRLIEQDDSNYDAADDFIPARKTPDRPAYGRDADFYVDPYASCENSTMKLSENDLTEIRTAMAEALIKRNGKRLDPRSFEAPLSDDLILSSGISSDMYFTTTTTQNEKSVQEYISDITILPHDGREVPNWLIHDTLIPDDKKAYTLDHSTVREFELIMRPKLYMHPLGKESFKLLHRWIEYITGIGLFYMGAQTVRGVSGDVSVRVQLIFSADIVVISKEYPEHFIPTEDVSDTIKKLRPWDPVPEFIETQLSRGKEASPRIIVHCIFETQEPKKGVVKDSEYRFVFYYYSD